MTRITKEPDIRKQEILNGAMELFATNGFEKTTMTDIARHLNISQGLCYRYFKSKDEIFDIGLEQYAEYFVEAYRANFNDSTKSLKEKINTSSTYFDLEKKDDVYYQFFHRQENNTFHILLSFKICEKMCPVIIKALQESVDKKEIDIKQVEVTASFLLYGQLGILLDNSRSDERKINEIRDFVTTLLEKLNS